MVEKAKMTAEQKDSIRQAEDAKEARLLAAILEAHPKLSKDEALEALKEAGAL